MYKCNICSEKVKGSEKRLVTKIRNVTYFQFTPRFNHDNRKYQPSLNESFKGWEIVNEASVCDECYKVGQTGKPEIVGSKEVKFYSNKSGKRVNEKLYNEAKGDFKNEKASRKDLKTLADAIQSNM